MTVVVDARGHRCPVPTLKLRRALETADEVTLLADDPMARIDVPYFAAQIGAEVVSAQVDGAELTFVVRRLLKHLSPAGEREAPTPQAWEGEGSIRRPPRSSPRLPRP